MSTLLHIDSSARRTGSVSRRLTARFVEEWRRRHPDGRVIERDLALDAPPHVDEAIIGAYFTPDDARSDAQRATLAQSDALVDELLAADTIVIGAPMYNFALPSSLKAWIDHVVRVGRTFSYGAGGPQGLVRGKRVVVILSRGGVYSDGPAQAMDFQTGYLRGVLGFIGIADVEFVAAEGVAHGEENAREAIAKAEDQLLAAA
ncbi:FMN-dependent NADH-azoreductase [Tahibacter soli]|jgi:FMN-dependent NADH-azoreductase|uniref:FMN dependent NADH:quinone oxidoreductase n=1 Tax=Tahibacter soli TaxID=2983605 RepID=A0A9X3YP30_9GAMM|nr:FMN-dependent NADH-azoreductase [Tahibacter soli]MDC8015861.1 FMN-dependent NADH-azoreductase [Tahibacter soli]